MNLRLILAVTLLLIPFVVKGQEASKDVKFYSEGKIYVGNNYTKATDPSLFIVGSAAFSNTTKEVSKTQIEQVGVTKLTGDFVDMIAPKDATGVYLADSLFAKKTVDNAKGVIWFAGKDTLQRIYRDKETFETVPVESRIAYLNFPTLRVGQVITDLTVDHSKYGYVSVDTSAVISVKNLEIGGVAPSNYEGGFAVEASYMGGRPDRIKSAYALIYNINGNLQNSTSNGWSRVNLKLNDPSKPNTYIPEYTTGMESSTDPEIKKKASRRYLTGFSSPFKQLAADYMFFHVLFKPGPTDLTSNEGPQQKPTFIMESGIGYFIAMDVSTFDKDKIQNDNQGVRYINRFQGGYEFSRYLLSEYYGQNKPEGTGFKYKFSQFKTDGIEEFFNTEPVKVSLKKGLNFLGNPFMAPIDLDHVIQSEKDPLDPNNNSYTAGEFAKYADGSPVMISRNEATSDRDIRAKYWVFDQASVRDEAVNVGGQQYNWYYYSVQNYHGQPEGSTSSDHMIPPLSLFCLQVATDFDIYLQRPSEEVFKKPVAYGHKSGKISNVVDDLLIKAIDLESGLEDRTSLVFRDKSMASGAYDYIKTRKNLSASIEGSKGFVLPEGSVYTKATDGKPMLSNPVSNNIKQLALYLVPSSDRVKHIRIKPERMESLRSINKIWVEDKLNPGVYEELTPEGLDYIIEPTAEDTKNNLANRFVLYFNELPNGGNKPEIEENSFTVYYYGSTLTIKGLIDSDMGSKVDIYDIQGRLVANTRISDVPTTTFLKPLAHGTYIVKIKGKRNHTSKFISLQN